MEVVEGGGDGGESVGVGVSLGRFSQLYTAFGPHRLGII